MDQEGGGTQAISKLAQAILLGKTTVAAVDTALKRLYRVRMRLGMLDPPTSVSYNTLNGSEALKDSHLAVARKAVRVPSRPIPPPWRSIRSRLAPRTHAPCGPWGVRAGSQTKSRKAPTHPGYITALTGVQALASMTLLKNDKGALPLATLQRGKTLAIIGPQAKMAGLLMVRTVRWAVGKGPVNATLSTLA